jgi:hypothetical protein
LIAVENSPPSVTPNVFCDWLVAMAQALGKRRIMSLSNEGLWQAPHTRV